MCFVLSKEGEWTMTKSEPVLSFSAAPELSVSLAQPRPFLFPPPTFSKQNFSCGPMMLDVLFKIKDEQDTTLAFRRSCR